MSCFNCTVSIADLSESEQNHVPLPCPLRSNNISPLSVPINKFTPAKTSRIFSQTLFVNHLPNNILKRKQIHVILWPGQYYGGNVLTTHPTRQHKEYLNWNASCIFGFLVCHCQWLLVQHSHWSVSPFSPAKDIILIPSLLLLKIEVSFLVCHRGSHTK